MKKSRNDAVKTAVTSYLERRNYPVSVYFTSDNNPIYTYLINNNTFSFIRTLSYSVHHPV